MTPDRAAITALQAALDAHPGLDHEGAATLAVTTLQGLGWRAPGSVRVLATHEVMSRQEFDEVSPLADRVRSLITDELTRELENL